jgi:MFS superfamily sulfate permease-like transporter
MIGLALAVAVTGWRVVRARIEVKPVGDGWHVVVEGACTFLALPRLTGILASVPERTSVTIHLLTSYLDHAAHQAISDWQRRHCATGGQVHVRESVDTSDCDTWPQRADGIGWSRGKSSSKANGRNVHLRLVEELSASGSR